MKTVIFFLDWEMRAIDCSVPDPAPILDTHRVLVRPVHEAAEVVPLIHAAKADSVANRDWDTLGNVDVVRYQQ